MISIIIPVYNAERYLHQCIESVIAQTFEDWEAILVNDGSKDGSLAICQEYAAKDKRIKVIDKSNGGPSSARNKGLENAQGEFVYFMDADDWIEKNYLEVFFNGNARKDVPKGLSEVVPAGNSKGLGRIKRVSEASDNINEDCDYDIIFQGFVRELADGRKEESFAMDADTSMMSKEEIICRLYKEHVYGWSWCKLFRREIIEKHHIRFDESLRLWEDELFTSEFLKYAEKVSTVNSHLYHYIYYPNSLMQTNNTYLKRLFLSERMNEALMPIANDELKEYMNTTYNKNLKYSLLMALKNEPNHRCDEETKVVLLDRYYTRIKEYPELKKYNVLSNKIAYTIAECILQIRCEKLIIKLMSNISR